MISRHPLVVRAAALVPLLADHAAEADRTGRLADFVVSALRAEGFLALHAPRAAGGHEASFHDAFDVYRELGRGCGSSAWTAMVLSGGSYMAALLGSKARAELWGQDPGVAVCSQLTTIGKARAAAGGMGISGRWQPASGAHHSAWAMVTVSEDGQPADSPTIAVLPTGAGSIEHTWEVSGLRATGSDTLVFDEVFVPDHRLLSFSRLVAGGYAADHPDEPLYGGTVINALTLTVVAPLLGMAEAALDGVITRLGPDAAIATPKKPRRADTPAVRAAVAEAASNIDTARLRCCRALTDIEDGILARKQLEPVAQARVSMDAATAADSLRAALRLLLTAVGSAAFSSANALQRIWRDMEIALAHSGIALEDNRDAYGKALLDVT